MEGEHGRGAWRKGAKDDGVEEREMEEREMRRWMSQYTREEDVSRIESEWGEGHGERRSEITITRSTKLFQLQYDTVLRVCTLSPRVRGADGAEKMRALL